ncbi:sugar transferase [Crocinitomix catalasitica]|nr:sugar transferase [Crocinitomix catalasitica]
MYELSKRIFDVISSLVVLQILLPFLLVFALIILIGSKGGVLYSQERVGKNGKIFHLLKFRSMKVNADKEGQLTVGDDHRVTNFGKFLRASKMDEIPQLLNIIVGQMSVVGPRPEVQKYVHLYNAEQLKVLSVKPGLTDLASVEYMNEQEQLGQAVNPEEHYVNVIMPKKLELNLDYIEKRNFLFDLRLIFKTIGKILF